MATSVARIPASFRFQSSLLEELKEKAKASNRDSGETTVTAIVGNYRDGVYSWLVIIRR